MHDFENDRYALVERPRSNEALAHEAEKEMREADRFLLTHMQSMCRDPERISRRLGRKAVQEHIINRERQADSAPTRARNEERSGGMDSNANDVRPELAEMAKTAKTEEDLQALAQEDGYELTGEQLEGVAGGFRCLTLKRLCDGYYCETYCATK